MRKTFYDRRKYRALRRERKRKIGLIQIVLVLCSLQIHLETPYLKQYLLQYESFYATQVMKHSDLEHEASSASPFAFPEMPQHSKIKLRPDLQDLQTWKRWGVNLFLMATIFACFKEFFEYLKKISEGKPRLISFVNMGVKKLARMFTLWFRGITIVAMLAMMNPKVASVFLTAMLLRIRRFLAHHWDWYQEKEAPIPLNSYPPREEL